MTGVMDLRLGDCSEILPTLPDDSVDCVFVDLLYFETVDHDWDNQWKDRADYLDWICRLAEQWKRVTKDNSSIFVFCDEKMEAYIQVRLDEYFLLLNKIVWFKKNALPQKNAHNLRTFAPMTERALFYTTQYDSTGWETVKLDMNNFMPLREYFRQFQAALGMNKKQIIERVGQKADHAFRYDSTQWDLPTPETYEELLALNPNHGFKPKDYEALRQDYEALRQDYEALRQDYEALRQDYEALRQDYETLRRPFHADTKTWDVIEWAIIGGDENTEHPTTKPLGLCKRILSVITDRKQVVLDCCMGSGTAGEACVILDRGFIGIENKPSYFAIAEKRIHRAQQQMVMPL